MLYPQNLAFDVRHKLVPIYQDNRCPISCDDCWHTWLEFYKIREREADIGNYDKKCGAVDG